MVVTKSALVEDYYSSPPSIFIYVGSGRSHPENADPDQQVAKKDEAKYTLLVEWTNQQK